MDRTTPVSALNFGQGIFTQQGDDLVLGRTNGSEFRVNLDGVQNVQDVLNRINNHVDNFNPALRITASLATVGGGIVLTSLAGAAPIEVRNAGGSQAAWGLGLVPRTTDRAVGIANGAQSIIGGRDVSGIEVEGVFSSLIRMKQAIEQGQVADLGRVTAALDTDLQRMSLARSFIGTRQQSIDRVQELTDEQQVQLKQIESDELDADLAQVISRAHRPTNGPASFVAVDGHLLQTDSVQFYIVTRLSKSLDSPSLVSESTPRQLSKRLGETCDGSGPRATTTAPKIVCSAPNPTR
jgi:flagellar hook-associated protein 3 FlgL